MTSPNLIHALPPWQADPQTYLPGSPVALGQPPAQPLSSHSHAGNNEDPSIWRDTGLRYAGYADEVGEFMGPYLGGLGKFLGYGISSLYVLADMGTTLPQKYKAASPELTRWQKLKKTGAEALDLGVFHTVATLLVPPMIIGWGAHYVDKHWTSDGSRWGQWVQNHPNVQAFANKQLPWANARLQPKLARAGQTIAKFMRPLETQVAKWNPESIKRIPIFGSLLADLPDDLKDLRQLNQFKFKQDNIIRLLLQKSIPVAVGVGMVPLIAHPFDMLMLKIQDWTIRPLLGKNKIVRDAQGKRQSIKNPTFWGQHPKQKHLPIPTAPAAPLTGAAYSPIRPSYPVFNTHTRFGVFPQSTQAAITPYSPRMAAYNARPGALLPPGILYTR